MKTMVTIIMAVLTITVIAQDGKIEPTMSVNETFKSGISGKAIFMDGKTKIQFDSKYIKANAGTIELWVKPENLKDYQYMLNIGSFGSQLFIVGYDNKSINFLNMKKGGKKYEYYLTLQNKTTKLKKGKWRAFAFVWAYIAKGQCLVQIYVDGKLVEERYDATIGDKWGPQMKNIGIGYSTSSITQKGYMGAMDEVRISNYPKTPSEIKKAFDQVKSGKALKKEKGTLLLLNFEKNINADSSTNKAIPQGELKKAYEKVLNEVHPE